MKIEGWQYFQLAGSYRQFKTHSDAYAHFAGRVEQYIQKDFQVKFKSKVIILVSMF